MIRGLLFVVAFICEVNAVLNGYAGDDKHLILFKSKTIDTSIASPKAIFSSQLQSDKKTYIVVQFKDPVEKNQKDKLKALGVEFLDYIPNNAYVVRAPESSVPLFSTVKGVQWVGDYKPSFKIDPKLLNHEVANEEQKIKLVIHLFKGEPSVLLREFVVKRSGEVLYYKKSLLKVLVARKFIQMIAQRKEVSWIEEAREPKLIDTQFGTDPRMGDPLTGDDDPVLIGEGDSEPGKYEDLTGYESGVQILKADSMYGAGITGRGQVVTVADTGLDVGEISNRLSLDFQGRVLKGYPLGYFSESWADANGHGTHVSGSILGSGAYSDGLLSGVAFDAELVMQSLSGGLGGLNVPLDLWDLFEPVYKEGSRVHSNSWGMSTEGDYDQFSKSLDEFVWSYPDMVVVMAAGNGGSDKDKDGVIDEGSLLSPATAKNCITVGASENIVFKGGIQRKWSDLNLGQERWGREPIASDRPSDHENGIAAFSSRGPTSDGRVKPDVVAPGTNILSTRSHDPNALTLWGEFNEHYVWSGGTSMATPLVSGAATLVRQLYMDSLKLDWISAALIKATLINGADDLYPGQFGFGGVQEISQPRPNVHEGWGRVNLENPFFLEYRALRFSDEQRGVSTGEVKVYDLHVTDPMEPLRVTLVYTDYPASVQGGVALVNDLDLEVISPDREKFYPNGGDHPDRRNNVETIDIARPDIVGNYTVRVRGYNVPQGTDAQKQPFALVASGGIE